MRPKHPTSPAAPTSTWSCLRIQPDACVLDVSVSPNAKRTELVGWHDGALRIRLQAPPVDGAANEALRKWLAQSLALPTSQVTLLRGETSRRKQLSVCCSPEAIEAWLSQQTALRNADADPETP